MTKRYRRYPEPFQEQISIHFDMAGRPAINSGTVEDAKKWLEERTDQVRKTIIHEMGGLVFNLFWLHPNPTLRASVPCDNLLDDLETIKQLPNVIDAKIHSDNKLEPDGWY